MELQLFLHEFCLSQAADFTWCTSKIRLIQSQEKLWEDLYSIFLSKTFVTIMEAHPATKQWPPVVRTMLCLPLHHVELTLLSILLESSRSHIKCKQITQEWKVVQLRITNLSPLNDQERRKALSEPCSQEINNHTCLASNRWSWGSVNEFDCWMFISVQPTLSMVGWCSKDNNSHWNYTWLFLS